MASIPIQFQTKQGRQRVVTAMLRVTRGTRLEPQAGERLLRGRFVRGQLTLEQVIAQLAEQSGPAGA